MTEPVTRRTLLIAFLVLEGLAGLSWWLSTEGVISGVLLAIAAIQLVVSGVYFMELRSEHAVHRAIATIVVFFIVLLCVGAAGDAALR